MIYKTRLISLLGAVAFVGFMGTQSLAMPAAGELDDFPVPTGILSKVVDLLPTKYITPFALSTRKARAAVQSNRAVKYFKANDISPEPTITISQAFVAKKLFMGHELAGYLFSDASRKFAKAKKARRVKLREAQSEEEAKNHERVAILEKEAQKLKREKLFYKNSCLLLKAESEKFLTLACDLGDSQAILSTFGNYLKYDVAQVPPTTTAVTFLEPLVAKGFVTARKVRRDFLIRDAQDYDTAIALNEELKAEGYLEPFRFQRTHRVGMDTETEIMAKLIQLKEHDILEENLARAGTVDNFRKLLGNFRINSSTFTLVTEEIANSKKALRDVSISIMVRGSANYDKYKLYKGFTDVLTLWLDEHKAKFQTFNVCQNQTEEQAKLLAEFTTLINGCEDKTPNISKAAGLFYDRKLEFESVSQLALLLSTLPNETTADHLRSMIVDRIGKLHPEWREVEGIYTFLLNGGGRFDPKTFNQLPSETKSLYQIAAFKYARLIGYVPPHMR